MEKWVVSAVIFFFSLVMLSNAKLESGMEPEEVVEGAIVTAISGRAGDIASLTNFVGFNKCRADVLRLAAEENDLNKLMKLRQVDRQCWVLMNN
ncbi:hypothetical protein [Vreelandella salicampi]|uniref:Uncharacterized protein n=1 Tax=Vreelandella salicampi TaxID=1449798 RepID=A0A7Z0LJX8_9GAMM|nr:hypothetical protein [Halomonas salicampi]NYS60357.1 hypothetical protein [Halomonas salicampi]